MLHFNLKYFCCALVCIPVGLASREWIYLLPSLLALYAGDAIWAMLVYFLMRSVIADLKTSFIAAVVFSFAIEFLQLYQASWIEAIRSTTIGGLILGFGFLWSDLLCYTAGIILAALIDHFLLGSHNNK